MPNWCTGILKIKGKQQDVFNLLVENLEVWKTIITKKPFEMREELDTESIEINKEDFEIWLKQTAYIKGTHRNFVETDYINAQGNKDGNSCVAIEIRGAWNIESRPYVELAKKYNVDIKIEAFECGCQFSRFILIENGELIEDKDIEYDNYVWDCVMPNLGG